MKTQWVYSMELWFAIGLLALNLSFAIERYAPVNDVSLFLQGMFIGISAASNIVAIALLPRRIQQPNR